VTAGLVEDSMVDVAKLLPQSSPSKPFGLSGLEEPHKPTPAPHKLQTCNPALPEYLASSSFPSTLPRIT